MPSAAISSKKTAPACSGRQPFLRRKHDLLDTQAFSFRGQSSC
jgi:hypothetical protein